jgi:DNA-binding transcriptional regulator YhcF (GntR family)
MILFNREMANYAYYSMTNAGIKETIKGFKKDKSEEKKESISQEKTTHLSDAVDTLITGKYSSRVISGGAQFVSNLWV